MTNTYSPKQYDGAQNFEHAQNTLVVLVIKKLVFT